MFGLLGIGPNVFTTSSTATPMNRLKNTEFTRTGRNEPTQIKYDSVMKSVRVNLAPTTSKRKLNDIHVLFR